jgi:hypothetical protein
MTYSTGGIVQATDYNGFVSTTAGGNINATWNTAYGQTALATVSAGATVTAIQWATLNSTISSMAAHQGTSITSRTSPTAGNIISALANVSTDITNCYTNRFNAATQGTQYTAWTGTASKTAATGSGASPWAINFQNNIFFANTTAATNFFNAGGLVKIQFSKTSTGTSSDTEWNAFAAACGTIYLSSTGASKTLNGATYTGTTKVGGSGTPTVLATGTGFAQLTSSSSTIFLQYDAGTAYSSNYIQVNASYSSGVLAITAVWFDNGDPFGASISGGTATSGITFGSAPTTVVTYFPPETTYLTNTWGTPTVSSTVV